MSRKAGWPLLAALLAMLVATAPARAQSMAPEVRIKELAHVQGVSINNLVGYGLVVGLAGTGDQTAGGGLTSRSVANMLQNLGVMNIPPEAITAHNVAVVLVTASMPPYSKSGDSMDVTVSSMGDARSLQGGQLVQTTLKGADGQVYALAQGPVAIGGAGSSGGGLFGGGSSNQGRALAGRVPNGGLLVRDLPDYATADNGDLTITLNQPDATTASTMAQTIRNAGFAAVAVNPSTIRVQVPPASAFSGNRVDLVARIEQLQLRPDHVARVVIDERTGTVVMGGDVTLGPCAIAHGNLRVVIQNPVAAFGARSSYTGGGIGTGPRTQSVLTLGAGATLRDVTDALNNIGVTPRDLIAIVQALKTEGALDAELVMQ